MHPCFLSSQNYILTEETQPSQVTCGEGSGGLISFNNLSGAHQTVVSDHGVLPLGDVLSRDRVEYSEFWSEIIGWGGGRIPVDPVMLIRGAVIAGPLSMLRRGTCSHARVKCRRAIVEPSTVFTYPVADVQ